jgi:hypothetical protein
VAKTKLQKQSESVPMLFQTVADVDLVRFERNLLQIGFFGAHDVRQHRKSSRRFEQTITQKGHRIQGAIEFRSSDQLGLPSMADQDRFLAFMRIASEQRALTGTLSNTICFSGYRLLKEMGQSLSGSNYEDILSWGKRMTDTTITTERMIYFASRKEYSDETVHVFRSFKRLGILAGRTRRETFEVVLEDWLLENLNQSYVVPEDFNAYKQLNRPTAKGIFGSLHIWFYASKGKPVEKDYQDLCKLLNIQTYPHLSKIKEKMGASLDELVKINYLSQWDIQPRNSQPGFKLILFIGSALLAIQELTQKKLPLCPPPEVDPEPASPQFNQAVSALQQLGVSLMKSREILAKHDADEVLDYLEYIKAKVINDRRGRIDNPAGLLIYSLDQGLPIPSSYVTLSQRRTENERFATLKKQQDIEHRLGLEYTLWRDQEVERAIKTTYPGLLLTTKISQIKEEHKQDVYFTRLNGAQRDDLAMQFLRKEVRDSSHIPTFETWSKTQQQL